MLPTADPTVIFQRVADGAVLFAPGTEIYFGLNEVGARVWELLPPTTLSMDDLCARLQEVYPDVDADIIRQDVEELLTDLTRQGLVRSAVGASDPDVAST